jgi:hypothetical protein
VPHVQQLYESSAFSLVTFKDKIFDYILKTAFEIIYLLVFLKHLLNVQNMIYLQNMQNFILLI